MRPHPSFDAVPTRLIVVEGTWRSMSSPNDLALESPNTATRG
ncbi:unannotated protein [freshwater metagenome]|uniref:Unannotated protein n=1 Tax=freshwater metagenome TaxID=449393 RepID=A0A6J7NQY8_9ZZZZ